GRTPPLAQNVVLVTEPDDIVYHQEIARETESLDHGELVFELPVGGRAPGGGPVPVGGATQGEFPQPGVLVVTGGHIERRQLRRDQLQIECAILRDEYRIRYRSREFLEQAGHFRARTQMGAAGGGEP